VKRKAGADGPTVRRLIRALVAHGVFEELESGRAFGKTIFERNAETPEDSELFSEAMASYKRRSLGSAHGGLGSAPFRRLADIGGGTGRLIADLLAAHSGRRGILFDLPMWWRGAGATPSERR
jgi:hypothetical protein